MAGARGIVESMNQMKIEYLPVASLHPYERNAKQHPPEQVEHIANSIREFGFRQPLVVDAENVVVIGHGRLMAAEKLGLDTVPVVRADDLSEAQIKALRLADNKTNESGWDLDILDDEIDILKGDFDMQDFGFELNDTEQERKIKATAEGNPTLKLPNSRMFFVAVSAFGTESEVLLQAPLNKAEAEKIISIHRDGKANEILQGIKELINAD